MVAGVPAAPFRGGVNTSSTHCNPAWINLAGSIAGLDFGHGRVDFVWPSDQGRRPAPAAPPLATQDNRRRRHHAGYHWIEVTASLDQHPYDQRIGREDPQIPLAGVKRCDALGEGEEVVLEALVRGDTLDGILGRICRLFDALSVASRCSILLIDHTAGRLRYGAGPDLPAEYRTVIDAIPFGSSDAFWGTDTVNKEALVVADIVSDPAWCGVREFALAQGIRSCWSFPLVAEDAVHGVLAIHHEELRGPDDREVSIARRLARLAAVAILRRPADEPVPRNEERHALAVQGADIGIWDWDIERGTLYWSPLLKSMVGMTPEDEPVPGTTFKNLLHPDDQERVEEVLRRHLAERQPYDTACRLRRPDGSYRWIRVKAQATWNAAGSPIRLAGCIHDITDQKRAEDELRAARDAAETASRAKSLFLATISQELRTPLNTILGMGEILKDAVLSPPSARCQENTAVIHRSGQHLLGLIDDILEMARLEAEQVEFHEEAVALAAVLDEAIQAVRLSQRQPRHRLTLDLPSPLPVLSADRRCLKQVLINVLSEAVKSTPKDGRVAVKVSRSGAALDIVVEDSGPGDAGDVAPNVLHPLFRLENVMAQRHQGTALGLFISKVLVERHGGIFQVESNPGRGRAVYISLPAERLPTGMVRPVNGTRVWRHLARNVI